MDLHVTLRVDEFPEGFDHFSRQLALQVGKHLEEHLRAIMLDVLSAVPPPTVTAFTEDQARVVAQQAVFAAMEQHVAAQSLPNPDDREPPKPRTPRT